MSRPLDAERVVILKDLSITAVLSGIFPEIKQPGHYVLADGQEPQFVPDTSREAMASANAAAFMVLLAADELGMSLVDALNRARFDETGLTFAPATTTTFDNALRAEVDGAQKAEKRATKKAERERAKAEGKAEGKAAEQPVLMPEGFPGNGRDLGTFTVGELAYFIDSADSRGGYGYAVDAAWARLAEKLQTATALDLGKLQRWIVNAKFPHLKTKFADVLVIAEQRLKSMGAEA